MMDELKGRSVRIDVDEPFGLIADAELTIHGTVTEVVAEWPEPLRLAVASEDPRLEGVRSVSASPRHTGDSFGALTAKTPVIVHGDFFTADGIRGSGYIGLLSLVS